MITGHKNAFIARCRQRGYELEQAMACVVSQSGDMWTVDPTHPNYPRDRNATPPPPPPKVEPKCLAGTALKDILRSWLGITGSPNCSCNARARKMDEWGCDECERRIEEIVGWLEEEAKKRRLPFVRAAGTQIVKLAIRRARKAASRGLVSGHKSFEDKARNDDPLRDSVQSTFVQP